jgi:hypothetical protein
MLARVTYEDMSSKALSERLAIVILRLYLSGDLDILPYSSVAIEGANIVSGVFMLEAP